MSKPNESSRGARYTWQPDDIEVTPPAEMNRQDDSTELQKALGQLGGVASDQSHPRPTTRTDDDDDDDLTDGELDELSDLADEFLGDSDVE